MRDSLLLIKAARNVGDGIIGKSRRFFIGILVFFTIICMFMITIQSPGKDSSSMVISFMNLLNFSTIYTISFGYILRSNKANIKNDFLQLIVQLPIDKKAFSTAKFLNIWICMIPAFIVLIYQNLVCSLRSLEGVTGYIGLCTVMICFQFIILSFVSGMSSYVDPKSKQGKVFSFLAVIMIFLIVIIIFATIGFNNEEVYYGLFGEGFVKVFQMLEFFSGINSGIAIIISLTVSYVVGCIIPDRLYSKRGWNV